MRFIKQPGIRPVGIFVAVALAFACGAGWAQSAEARGGVVMTLCDAMPNARADAVTFAQMFAEGDDDLDADGLPDGASLALLQTVACDSNAPVSMAVASGTAFNANLAFFDAELDTTGLEGFREAIAALMTTNATTEAAVKAVLAALDTPITLAADYTQVTCTGGTCMPAPVRQLAAPGEFLDFAVTRAADEPYAADGDLDGDGVTNLTEWNNIQAQGGDLEDFIVAATSPDLDGTEPVRSTGGGGCFIATAAYGTPLAHEITTLRAWRDKTLLTHSAGSAFADLYYRLSPPIAERVSNNAMLASAIRAGFVPVIATINGGALGVWVGFAGIALLAGLVAIRRVTSPDRRPPSVRGR